MTLDEIRFFDRLSDSWDADEVRSTPARVSSILSKIGVKEGWRVLDLGTGTGVLIPFLTDLVGPRGRVDAVDISEGMLSKAREKFGYLPNVGFFCKDFEREPLEGVYDLVMMYCVYPHLHEPRPTLERLLRENLVPGGCLVVAFPSDENFINSLHRERKAESDLLPDADSLAERFHAWGFNAEVLAASPEEYIVAVEGLA